MASRSFTDLDRSFMPLAIDFSDQCAREGLDVLIYCTHRDFHEQAKLYRNGRRKSLIRDKYNQLIKLGREDLAEILMDVGPQKGRSILTNAGPGQSYHNYGFAFDGCPLRNGKPVWGTSDAEDRELWSEYGRVAADVGLEWSGKWTRFKEYPHCQMPGVDWRVLIQKADD